MNTALATTTLSLEPYDAKRLANLCGQLNEHIQLLAKRLNVRIKSRGNLFQISGESAAIRQTSQLLHTLYDETRQQQLTPNKIHLHLQSASLEDNTLPFPADKGFRLKRCHVKPRGKHQQRYLQLMTERDINFGIGPAGTGKTWLAVAAAVQALEQHEVERILLVRPAVEAGEKLGFLPGDMADKVDPYLRPLYDALYDMLGTEKVEKLSERNVIEIAPLAYMRGRTLDNCFVILDEAQNTTPAQMKMFLTRIGFGTHAVITGDITQVDLPRNQRSGLAHALQVLGDIDAIGITHFDSADIVRHPLVQQIVEAYEQDADQERSHTLAHRRNSQRPPDAG